MRFGLTNAFVFITIVAVFLGLRQTFLVDNLPIASNRTQCLPPLFALIFGVWACVEARGRRASRWLVLKIVGSAVLGAVVVATVLAIEFAETLRRIEYWDWLRNWPTLLPFVLTHAVYGLTIGVLLWFACWLNQVFRGNRLEPRM